MSHLISKKWEIYSGNIMEAIFMRRVEFSVHLCKVSLPWGKFEKERAREGKLSFHLVMGFAHNGFHSRWSGGSFHLSLSLSLSVLFFLFLQHHLFLTLSLFLRPPTFLFLQSTLSSFMTLPLSLSPAQYLPLSLSIR